MTFCNNRSNWPLLEKLSNWKRLAVVFWWYILSKRWTHHCGKTIQKFLSLHETYLTFLLDHKWTGTTIKIISCLYAWLILFFFFFSIQTCGWFSILSHISCMSNLTCTLPNTFIPRYTFRPIIQLSAKLLNIS